MEIIELQHKYQIAAHSVDIGLKLAFLKELVECNSLECIQFHYNLLRHRDDRRFYQMIRAAFQKRGSDAGAFIAAKMATETDVQVKADIVQILGHLRYTRALYAIRSEISSEVVEIRYAVVVSLGWMGGSDEVDLLARHYSSEADTRVRGYTMTALRQIYLNHEEFKKIILKSISGRVDFEKDDDVRKLIIVSCQTISNNNFGLRESINTGKITGNVQKSWEKLLEFFKSL